MVQIIFCIAFKGGVSKTSSSMMIGYVLAQRGFKTLLVDLDPQANLTGLALRTKLANGGEDTEIDSSLMKRYGTLEEQAAPICFLASEEASYITGSVMPVGGGDQG